MQEMKLLRLCQAYAYTLLLAPNIIAVEACFDKIVKVNNNNQTREGPHKSSAASPYQCFVQENRLHSYAAEPPAGLNNALSLLITSVLSGRLVAAPLSSASTGIVVCTNLPKVSGHVSCQGYFPFQGLCSPQDTTHCNGA